MRKAEIKRLTKLAELWVLEAEKHRKAYIEIRNKPEGLTFSQAKEYSRLMGMFDALVMSAKQLFDVIEEVEIEKDI